MEQKKCYMCDNPSTSREHVPPICLFPEIKDTKGINLRKDLITVPSCELHNSKKSDNDEFLMLSLSGLIRNNPVGNFHQLTKANRALRRKNKEFLFKEILKFGKIHKIRSTDGRFQYISIGEPNFPRLYDCLTHIAYGLYYNEFNTRFDGNLNLLMEFIDYSDENRQTFKLFLKKRFQVENKLKQDIKGANPLVFYYEFHKPDQNGLIAMRIVFYGSAEVYFAFIPKNIELPFNLAMKLMQDGVKTVISLNDEDFIFNRNI